MVNEKLYEASSIKLSCINCKSSFDADPWLFKCKKCNDLLEVNYFFGEISWEEIKKRSLNVWRYRELLPPIKHPITLNEGGTPLIKSKVFKNLYIKFEGLNPTGSFKDRGMTVAVSLAKQAGAKSVIVASTGNTAASASAYASRAGLKCYVLLPKKFVAIGKIAQANLHGSKIIEIEGNFDEAMKEVLKIVNEERIYPLNSFNAWRLEGQKTIAFEIYDQIGIPDWVIVPVGNAGNISAIWKGFKELKELGLSNKLPKMVGVQAEGASPIAKAWIENLDEPIFIDNPETIASAIRIGRPVNWKKAMKAIKESKGLFVSVKDGEIIEAQKKLARIEGIGAEPAGAASLAGFEKLIKEGIIKEELVIAIVTGHALKDPDSALKDLEVIKAKGKELINIIRNG